ncbi:hypothetical protein LEP1GSC049_2123 [Leptospira kirschneri serovar Cynopteri str. 3522 CT]|nr:hypothetical protein LEP1GSC044_2479 [Leptospira kirschneri serovar Grippotyphosa str. RM52]EKQ81920.1 hypothetical protein LEP1GSC064_0012 [Leptospira kirschneri serovar Grippotyphosa str. Moskva]EKR10038.1 hypothetical protein LEP1GSC122_3030 [Leptospira kirschneri serovar Valbuzzi str. 200702274]EMJ94465.1 hypothetical protein LEP1GSC198_3190 [Leptospira kirschneri str. JB]EMK01486.1 hypothetical protein LEP1GSC176_0560 [Leptospira kirschneri str. MMD1493]EMK14276.1 hypothetical protein 
MNPISVICIGQYQQSSGFGKYLGLLIFKMIFCFYFLIEKEVLFLQLQFLT